MQKEAALPWAVGPAIETPIESGASEYRTLTAEGEQRRALSMRFRQKSTAHEWVHFDQILPT
jgi:hypothetical protein